MNLQTLREAMNDNAKDVRLNVSSVLSEEGAPGLSRAQILGVALSVAHATRDKTVIEAIKGEGAGVLSDAQVNAAQAAAVIMAQNNVYYRTMHLAEDKDLSSLPAKLRMTIIGSPGIEKLEFEMYCLAVSAFAGCGMCIKAHVQELKKGGLPAQTIQSIIRIASVVNSAAQAVGG